MQKNPIIIVDDDPDDLELIREAFKSLGFSNELHSFSGGRELKEFLVKNPISPFLILCDVNIPAGDGFEVRKMLAEDEAIKYKSIPFVFWSTSASQAQIRKAYNLPAQGFFIKPSSFKQLQKTLSLIIQYWTESQHPKELA